MRNGVQPDHTGNGATALHRAAYSGASECCEALLKGGADVNALDMSCMKATDARPETPLDKALRQGHDRVAELLRS